MTVSQVIDIGREAMWIIMIVSGPLLLVSLAVGLVIGVFQAVTQIHEMTLTFVPKIIAIFGLLIYMLPWMVTKLIDYTVRLFTILPDILR